MRKARKAGRRSISGGCCCGCGSPAIAIRNTPSTDKAILRWNFCDVVDRDGVLHGGVHADGATKTFAEGRLGYGGVRGGRVPRVGIHHDPGVVARPHRDGAHLRDRSAGRRRDPRVTGTPAPVVTLPWVLLGLELDWRDDVHAQANGATRPLADIATLIYRIQEE